MRVLPVVVCVLLLSTACGYDSRTCFLDLVEKPQLPVDVTQGDRVEARNAVARAVADQVTRTMAQWVRSVPEVTEDVLRGFQITARSETMTPLTGQSSSRVWVQCEYADAESADAARWAVLKACEAEVKRAVARATPGGS